MVPHRGREHYDSEDIMVVDYIPELVDHTEGGLSEAQPATPSAYDWRTDASRASSTVPYGRPRHGDT